MLFEDLQAFHTKYPKTAFIGKTESMAAAPPSLFLGPNHLVMFTSIERIEP